MKLAHREVMKVVAKLGRDVGVRILLMRQVDVEANGFGSGVERAAIGGLHDSRSTAGHDNPVVPTDSLVRRAHETAEFASHFVVVALCKDTFRNCKAARQFLVAGVGRECRIQHIYLAAGRSRLADPRASKDYNRVANAVLFKQYLGLEIVNLQPGAPHGSPRKKVAVDVGAAITGAFENCLNARASLRILFWGLWETPGKWLASIFRGGRRWGLRVGRKLVGLVFRCAVRFLK